jgi:hypothetical protein
VVQIFLASLRQCIEAENWPAALCLALSLPEMAGAVESPEGEPRQRYVEWFNDWVGHKYRTQLMVGQQTFLSGADCYGLRCAMLYQGQDVPEGSRQYVTKVFDRFKFTLSVEDHCSHKSRSLHLHVGRFCRDLMAGGEAWLEAIKKDPKKTAVLGRTFKIESGPEEKSGEIGESSMPQWRSF